MSSVRLVLVTLIKYWEKGLVNVVPLYIMQSYKCFPAGRKLWNSVYKESETIFKLQTLDGRFGGTCTNLHYWYLSGRLSVRNLVLHENDTFICHKSAPFQRETEEENRLYHCTSWRFTARLFVRLFARSLARSIVLSCVRSFVRLFFRSAALSGDRSFVLSLIWAVSLSRQARQSQQLLRLFKQALELTENPFTLPL